MACSEFGERYLEVARGWNELHITQSPDQSPIVDVDLVPGLSPVHYASLEDVRSDLEGLAGSVPADEQDRELVKRKLESDLTYLRALGGEAIGFIEYVERTVGVTPEPISEDAIEVGRERLDTLLGERGLRYDQSHRQKFYEDRIITDAAVIRKTFKAGMAAVKRAAAEFLPGPEEGCEVKFTHRDDVFWVGYIGADSKGEIKVEVNTAKPLSMGRINTIAAHEYGGHALMLGMWRKAIRSGEINPILGFTTIHSDFAFQAEAVAQNAEFMLLDDSWDNAFEAEYNAHAMQILNNAHYMINTGVDPKEVEEYATERLPFDPTGSLSAEALIATHRSNLLFRTYLMTFVPALKAMRPVHSMDVEDQRKVLKEMYTRPMTPPQIKDLTSSGAE